jgi:CNT family concentrative nucleoside transporter
VVRGFAFVLRKTLGVSGAVGVAAAANIFIGMIEAPLLIRPFLRDMSRSGLFMVMTVGMATIAGNMFVIYATILADAIPGAAGHLLTASLISAPAAIAIAALMVPGTKDETDSEAVEIASMGNKSAMAALVNGTLEGVKLVVGVAALLVVAIALVSLVNQILELLPAIAGAKLSLERLLGWAMMPVAWALGVPWAEAAKAGSLLGTKVVLNELVAYLNLAALPAGELSASSRLILTYALCGFANFGSLGILLGGLTAMVPERRTDIVSLGIKSLVAGNLASFMTGAVAGLLG